MRNFARMLLVLGLIVPMSVSAAPKEGKKANKKKAKDPKSRIAFTDPSTAGPDFLVQGEYTGNTTTKNEEKKVGIQVIALGDGKFQLVTYEGGLPGDGWDGGEKVTTEGQTEDGVTTFFHEKGSAEISGGKVTISSSGGKSISTIDRVLRESPTQGMKPPKGAVVLFDGTSPDNFENGRMTEDGLLMQGVTSKQLFDSFTYHMEFLLPFMPYARGQARGNSGCYFQGRYEVQILDSFGLEGLYNECGGLYKISQPSVNMCFPPLSWQTYDVDYTAARYDGSDKKIKDAKITVRHNGVVIQKDVELPMATQGGRLQEGSEPGPIYLQDHGNPVRYRNIWLVEKDS